AAASCSAILALLASRCWQLLVTWLIERRRRLAAMHGMSRTRHWQEILVRLVATPLQSRLNSSGKI
ncbi:hypothetical protein ABTL94_19565, partial [Acinetobacter baumannii]